MIPDADAQPRWGRRLAGWTVAAAVLGGVFLLYAQPDFLVMLGNQIWACFG